MKKILLLLLLPIITLAQKECVIHITTDQYPTETYWTLFADSLKGNNGVYWTCWMPFNNVFEAQPSFIY